MAMDGVKIADLKEGMICDGTYILKEAVMKKTQAGKFYIDIIFMDNTGDVGAKKWDASNEDMSRLKANKLYQVNVRVQMWQNKTQLNVNSIRLAPSDVQARIAEFIPAAPYTPEEMLEVVDAFISKIQNSDMNK
ncbi:MAG: hypothetical protein R3232_04350, partial [Clostridia bacterium]|nr:hypothetical protein [Clostridia bacterium]